MAFCLGQRGVAIDVELGLALVRLGLHELRLACRAGCWPARAALRLCQLALGLIERRLERPRINLKEQLPFPDEGTFRVALLAADSPLPAP